MWKNIKQEDTVDLYREKPKNSSKRRAQGLLKSPQIESEQTLIHWSSSAVQFSGSWSRAAFEYHVRLKIKK